MRKTFQFFSLHSVNMSEKTLIFGDYSVNENKFNKRKQPINADKVDARRIIVSNKDSYCKKRFI